MNLATFFYVLMLLLLVGGLYVNRGKWAEGGISLIVWLALLALGWQAFGPPIHG